MRIVIDMQGAQTTSRFRGIGRYTMAFVQAVARNRGEHEIILALSGLFPDTIEPIRAAFDDLVPQDSIRVWHAPGPVKEDQPGNDSRREVSELLRESFLASLQPDLIHISSLFEGYVDDAVTSIGRFDQTTPVSVMVYDLIPLLNPDHYLKPNPRYEAYYRRKIEFIKQAALHLAISDFSRHEAISAIGIPAEQAINIGTAADSHFRTLELDAVTARHAKQKFGLSRLYILYTGGADERKNLPRLIEAYAALPARLREAHQLVFAGAMPEGDIAHFKRHARSSGVKDDELVFTGYVSDDDLVQLYNLCGLYVFPSWHEGFGLPALEAMACGAPVIGSNTTSLPEVIGLDEALFDPFDVAAISKKIAQALEDETFRNRLRAHGLQQSKKFSWDDTARRAIQAWEKLPLRRLGTADYLQRSCAYHRLLDAVASVTEARDEVGHLAVSHSLAQNEAAGIERQLLLDVSELCQHDAATGVQRVVRSYLKWLLDAPPAGFRVEPVYATRQEGYRYARRFTQRFLPQGDAQADDAPIRWQRGDCFFGLDMQHHVQLVHAGFYRKLRDEGVIVKFLVHDLLPIQLGDLFRDINAKELHEQWLSMIATTDGAVCVSKATAVAFDAWIAENAIQHAPTFNTDWVHNGADIDASQPSRGMPAEAPRLLETLRKRPTFLCVSTIEPRKRQGQILDALEQLWREGMDINLVFVGQQGWKTDVFVQRLGQHTESNRRLFWLEGISDEYLEEIYAVSTCLVAASLNEGFGLSLIEAARHGKPIIARDIPVFREVAGNHAEYFSGETAQDLAAAIQAWLVKYHNHQHTSSAGMAWSTWQESADNLKVTLLQHHFPRHQLLVDISELVQRDARTGIQRVVRSILKEWLAHPPEGYRVEPVYATLNHHDPYRYARQFTLKFLGMKERQLQDEPIDYAPGDVFFGLDLNHHVPRVHRNYLQTMLLQGVDVRFMVYDMLPIQFPDFWEPQHSFHLVVAEWLSVITSLGGAVCISKSVADELAEWIEQFAVKRQRPFAINWFHLGADVDHSQPTQGIPADAGIRLDQLRARPSFLMVGTLEPRKGHTQVLDAFEQLWDSGADVNLAIVGKEGWMVEDFVKRLHAHPELDRRLFWLGAISDEYLDQIYTASTCLIAASYGEGFGLPLIEAAQHKLPIIARDIPVFREVAGDHAYYFEGADAQGLAVAIKQWVAKYYEAAHPKSENMPWMTWHESANLLAMQILTKRSDEFE